MKRGVQQLRAWTYMRVRVWSLMGPKTCTCAEGVGKHNPHSPTVSAVGDLLISENLIEGD